MRRPLTVDLASAPEAEVRLLGGKGAGLARLARLGAPVPPAVAVTTAAFRAFCRANRIRPDAPPAGLASALRAGRWPPALLGEIERALEALPGGAVAVRSSATCEDGQAFSMAGQFTTFLGVPRAEVPGRIVECWAALHEGPARAYLARLPAGRPEMAVVLQSLVEPAWAGVAFSVDPVARDLESLLVEWVEGGGSDLVRGAATPHRLRLRRREAAWPPAGPDDPPPALRAHLLALRGLLLRVERGLGRPVDVEWCATREALFLLQARPITALWAPGDALWSSVNLSENFPAPLAPLAWSFLHRFYADYLGSVLRLVGWGRRDVAAVSRLLERATGLHGGRIHYDLTAWHGLVSYAPWSAALADGLDTYLGLEVPLHPPPDASAPGLRRRTRGPLGVARFVLHLALASLRTGPRLRRLEARLQRERTRWRRALREARHPGEALAVLQEASRLVAEDWSGPCGADLAVMLTSGPLGHLVERWCGRDRAEVLPTLLQGLEVASDEPSRLLWRLSRALPDREAAAGGPLDYPAWRAGLGPGEARAFERFLERFGARCYGDCALISPTFEERPELAYQLVRAFAARPGPGEPGPSAAARRERDRLADDMCGPLDPLRRGLLRWLHRRALSAVRQREAGRLLQSALFGEARAACLRAGELLPPGLLRDREEVFELDLAELRALARDEGPDPEALRRSILERRRQREAAAALVLPETFLLRAGEPAPAAATPAPVGPPEADGKRVLAGLAVSRGRVRGRAHVLRDPLHDAPAPGAILVAESADPGWTPLILLAAGLVLERGGVLSHGAIVAREAGIPALVQVRDACRIIADGAPVLLDADAGTVAMEAADG